MKTKTYSPSAWTFRLVSAALPLDRYAFPHARPEVSCRYRTGRVALRETARLKIVPQVREEGKRAAR
jgi:hypothetical protein